MEKSEEPAELPSVLESFFAQFGKIDSSNKIVLEEFFKELLNEK